MTAAASASVETVVRDGEQDWTPARVPGVSVKVLRRDRETGHSTSLVRLAPGARFPPHDHPGGEDVYVVEGDLRVGSHRLEAGDYLYTPPHGKHAASSERGCVFLVMLPKPVVILKD